MAITSTGAMYKSLIFDGESSRGYGVYITGQAVYNAPEREVEMISIPGRNGQFALDKGRFENIEVTYPAGIFADSETDFAEAISNFRNFLCSRKGYVRLTDEYNPNEYRMAIYKSGLEVEPALLRAGEFEIVFDCKPQRYLTSGETAVEMYDGRRIENPTLFDSSPLLEVEGSGHITMHKDAEVYKNYRIDLVDGEVGRVVLREPSSSTSYFNCSLLNIGDTITVNNTMSATTVFYLAASGASITNITWARNTTNISGTYSYNIVQEDNEFFNIVTTFKGNKTYTYGTNGGATDTFTLTVSYNDANNTARTASRQVTLYENYSYSSSSGKSAASLFAPLGESNGIYVYAGTQQLGMITGISTQSVLGSPTYIDCDLGEAYKIVNGEIISLNAFIELGSDLPVLESGRNRVSFTVDSLKITPRWWKV